MKSVMISIRPEWCKLIASGKKTVEVRKTRPMTPTPFKCFIYCTQGEMMIIGKYIATWYMANGRVVGEFTCGRIDDLDNITSDSWQLLKGEAHEWFKRMINKQARLTEEQLHAYANGNKCYGWHISDLVIYDKPKELTDFIHRSEGCCNDGKCQGCKWLDRGNGYNLEDDCLADFDTDQYSPLRKAPRSWCYVEELK